MAIQQLSFVETPCREVEHQPRNFLEPEELWPVEDPLGQSVATPKAQPGASPLRLLKRFIAWLFEPGEPAMLTVNVPDGWHPPVV